MYEAGKSVDICTLKILRAVVVLLVAITIVSRFAVQAGVIRECTGNVL